MFPPFETFQSNGWTGFCPMTTRLPPRRFRAETPASLHKRPSPEYAKTFILDRQEVSAKNACTVFLLPEETDSQFGCSPRFLTQDWWLAMPVAGRHYFGMVRSQVRSYRAPECLLYCLYPIVCTHQIESAGG